MAPSSCTGRDREWSFLPTLPVQAELMDLLILPFSSGSQV